MEETKVIKKFRGRNFFLSNFYPHKIVYKDSIYPTNEHAFQSEKCCRQEDRKYIRESLTPYEARARGQVIHMRGDWNEIRELVMLELLEIKFSHESLLLPMLLELKEYHLEEGNYYHDKFWGNCYCNKCGGTGTNMLGKMLMDIRDHRLREIEESKILHTIENIKLVT